MVKFIIVDFFFSQKSLGRVNILTKPICYRINKDVTYRMPGISKHGEKPSDY